MPTRVMLSIKPEFAHRIFNGTKQYEFRRRVFRNPSVRKIVVYATAPVGRVIGEFEIDDILELELDCLWERTKDNSGIPKRFFDAYFTGKEKGYAIKIGKTCIYDTPLDLQSNFDVKRPPQSFVYLE
jgi:predicted transcriptional regulator